MCQCVLSAFNSGTWQLHTAGWTLCVTYELVMVCWERERRGVLGKAVWVKRVSWLWVSEFPVQLYHWLGLKEWDSDPCTIQHLCCSPGTQECGSHLHMADRSLFWNERYYPTHSYLARSLLRFSSLTSLSFFHGRRPQSKENTVTSAWNLRSACSTCSSFFQFVTF